MSKITSKELQREYGRVRTEAYKRAVIITNHGRDDMVLLSVDEYKRLRALDQAALHPSELPLEVLDRMKTPDISADAYQYEHEYQP